MASHCKRCLEAGLKPLASPRKCGFDSSGSFTRENWNCGTLNQLRNVADKNNKATRWNDTSICYVPLPDYGGFVVLAWYKNRGCVEGAHVIREELIYPLTLEAAELAIQEAQDVSY